MGLENFKTYQLAVKFYRESEKIRMNPTLKQQFERASSSIVLNLAEGSAKPTRKDRKRFYHIALGSHRECIAILDLVGRSPTKVDTCQQLGAALYKLAKSERC